MLHPIEEHQKRFFSFKKCEVDLLRIALPIGHKSTIASKFTFKGFHQSDCTMPLRFNPNHKQSLQGLILCDSVQCDKWGIITKICKSACMCTCYFFKGLIFHVDLLPDFSCEGFLNIPCCLSLKNTCNASFNSPHFGLRVFYQASLVNALV